MIAAPDDEYAQIAEFYDHVVPYAQRPDVAFYVDAATTAGGPVLEIGCGTGRVLIPTARAGVDIVGVDASPAMLATCRQRLAHEPERVQSRVSLIHSDMRGFDFGREFALVTIPFRPFQHLLTVEDQLACLATIYRHLQVGGVLAFDVFNPSLDYIVNLPLGEEFGNEPEFTMPDGRRVVRRSKILEQNRFTQVGQHELLYHVAHPDGRVETQRHSFALRNIFRFEAEHLLARAGFEVEQLYADFDKRPYGSTYPGELIFVARKRKSSH
jgi:SAM-dependent methyltransferase